MTVHLREVAGCLFASIKTRERFVPPSIEVGMTTLDRAYRVQEQLVALMQEDERASVLGYKVAMLRNEKGPLPVAGAILSSRMLKSGAILRRRDYVHLGVEPEICFRIGVDIEPGDGRDIDICSSIDAFAPAFEIIDDRGATSREFEPSWLVAENGWCRGVVVGAFRPVPKTLVCRATYRTGAKAEAVDEADIDLAERFEMLLALVRTLHGRGVKLARGQIVMSGSVFPLQFPDAKGTFDFNVSGMGQVQVGVE